MTDSKKQKLLNKIKNLLDLAEKNSSVGEAETAAKKAQALIMKYNIEEAELREGEEPTIEEYRYPVYKMQKKNEGKWIRKLFYIIAHFNFCDVVYGKDWVNGEGHVDIVYLIGDQNNVELVKYIVLQLVPKFRASFKIEWKKYDGPDSYHVFRRNFFKGVNAGIYSKLHAQQQEFAEDGSTAIVLSKNKDMLDKFIKNKYPNLGTARQTQATSIDGYAQGREAGKKANINAGIRGKNGNKLLN